METPLLYTVILNTNRKDDTLACLESLTNNTYPNHRIIVLDNASTDGSPEAIADAYPQIEMIPLRENKGYAGNNNVGIAAAVDRGADWIFVLNEDTTLAPDCLEALLSYAAGDPQCGIVGPLVYHFDEPEVIQSAGGSLGPFWQSKHEGQNEPDRGQYHAPRRVEWVSGCAIMVRREVIEQVGMLDERFFYYWEETEWCLRTRRGGWQIIHVPSARLWHKGVQRNYKPGPNVTYYNTRNRLLMMAKHSAPLKVRAAAGWEILRTLISWTIKPQWRHMDGHRRAMAAGLRDYLFRKWGQKPS